ncbi:MAG: metallophosphoesterase [Eubacteriales bacterium]|nr:metallophosphoesterase [Eubacteriales bacterium]
MMKVRRYRIRTENGTGTGEKKREKLTVALITDFHNGDAAAVCAALDTCGADLIAVAGDLFLGYHFRSGGEIFSRQKNVLPLIRHCVKLAPTFFSLGNHEWIASEADLSALAEEGVVVLDNRWVRDRERGLVIGGLTSAMMTDCRKFRRKYGENAEYPHKTRHTDRMFLRTDAGWLDEFTAQEGYRILLSHHPEYWCLREPMLRRRKIDLVLSGHAHGGQIRLFGQGLYSPGQGPFPHYTGGVFRGPHGCMAVSRGTTNTASIIPRLFNPPEVVVLELV